jgi:lipoprotein NlpI
MVSGKPQKLPNQALIGFTVCFLLAASASGRTDDEAVTSYKNALDAVAHGDRAAALTNYNLAIALDPNFAEAYEGRGIVEFNQGDTNGALADYDRALQLAPGRRTVYNHRGGAKMGLGDCTGAIADFTMAIKLDPAYADAFNNRGLAEKMKGDTNAAAADFDKAIELQPRLAAPHNNRGLLEHLDEAAKLSPDVAKISTNPGLLKHAPGENASNRVDAQNDFEKAGDPTHGSLAAKYVTRGVLALVSREWDDALTNFDQAIALNPQNASAHAGHGRVQQAKGDLAGALEDYSQAIQLKPDFAPAYVFRAEIENEQGATNVAMADLNQAIALKPDGAEAYYLRGLTKNHMGDTDGAISDANKAIALNSTYAPPYRLRGYVHYSHREFPEALADMCQFCQLAPPETQDYARFHIWLIRMRNGERASANNELEAYLRAGQSRRQAAWPLRIGQFLLGQLTENGLINAAQTGDPAKTDGQLCEAWFYAGAMQLLKGDQATATNYFLKCLATGKKTFIEYSYAAEELNFIQTNRASTPDIPFQFSPPHPRTLEQALAAGPANPQPQAPGFQPAWQDYDELVHFNINRQWQHLIKTKLIPLGQVTVRFHLHEDGSVTDIRIPADADARMTSYCQAAILNCSPLPKWPDELRAGYQNAFRDMTFTFSAN